MATGLRLFPKVAATHLIDVYPGGADTQVADVEWIELAGRRNWSVLTKNPQILFTPHERDAIEHWGTRVFCLASGQWTREGQGLVVGRHLLPILRRATQPGPCFWRLYPDRQIVRDLDDL